MKQHKRKMGRPLMPPGEARTAELRIRLTPAEREALDKAAQSLGKETSTWAREVLSDLARSLTAKHGGGKSGRK